MKILSLPERERSVPLEKQIGSAVYGNDLSLF